MADQIYIYENEHGKNIQVKKVVLSSVDIVWYVYDESNHKWHRRRFHDIEKYYQNTFVKTRFVMFEKCKKPLKTVEEFDMWLEQHKLRTQDLEEQGINETL